MLPDGRRLAWADVGARGGPPLFYFHGFPGSRIESRLVAGIAVQIGIRVLVVERPGYGRSDFLPGRRLLDWPRDVAHLADALGFDRFAVAGVSGGGPYALACARAIPERLAGAGVICGMGPTDDPALVGAMTAFHRRGLGAVRRAPWFARVALSGVAPLFRHRPDWIIDRVARRASAPDRRFFEKPECRAIFVDTFREAFRQGASGAARDLQLLAAPWGFRLEEIPIRVHVWHGELDPIVPVAMGRHVARAVPTTSAIYYPGEGHFSLALGRAREMLEALTARHVS